MRCEVLGSWGAGNSKATSHIPYSRIRSLLHLENKWSACIHPCLVLYRNNTKGRGFLLLIFTRDRAARNQDTVTKSNAQLHLGIWQFPNLLLLSQKGHHHNRLYVCLPVACTTPGRADILMTRQWTSLLLSISVVFFATQPMRCVSSVTQVTSHQ